LENEVLLDLDRAGIQPAGSQVVQFTLIWYLTKETGSAAVLATSTFVSLLPNVFFAPLSAHWSTAGIENGS
jgi:hypothetical protein